MKLIAPSILSADFNHLGKEIAMINESEADFIHCDVMDGVFVPNISFGLPIIHYVNKISCKPIDVHLMIVEPDRYIKAFCDAGASYLTVHIEACIHLHRTIQLIKEQGAKASVCLNPHTPVVFLEDIIADLDMVLIMSVNPGFGGQEFIPNTYKKVSQLKDMVIQKKSNALIEVDGGINYIVGKKLFDVGADVLVAGNFIFNSENPTSTIHLFKDL